jgi:beta-glucuronidase
MKKAEHIFSFLFTMLILNSCFYISSIFAQSAAINISDRNTVPLNGQWQVIIDPTGIGEWREVWKEKKPVKKTDFFEYSFEGGPKLNVPGDFNTQLPELFYLEGIVWYKKDFNCFLQEGRRLFIHFGAVNYRATVYLNGNFIGSHEGGFTPFQFEITSLLNHGENTIIVKVDNRRFKDGLPGIGYDWFNYGGITRDVHLFETGSAYIEDYSIQLQKHSYDHVTGWIKITGKNLVQNIKLEIPELSINYNTVTDDEGLAEVNFNAKMDLWSPDNPRLYKVTIQSETDSIKDSIGFRCIESVGNKIFLNGSPIFLKGVNIHEENPIRAARAYSREDAILLLSWAKELGCNFIRLAHYPHNEHMIKQAEKMGLMVWEELPVYQHIEFSAPGMMDKMDLMLREMIRRDRNRCNVIIWCLSNETYDFTPNRNNALIELSKKCRNMDSTRLITSVINNQGYNNNVIKVWDPLYEHFDIISVNEYLGWYNPWQGDPKDTRWELAYNDKPVIISEFGGEALYGSNYGQEDEAAYWREEYQEQIYIDQINMFANVPNLAGVCPWLLIDYRSLGRMHPIFQNGWNRKGLISDKGEKKKAWYIMENYYKQLGNEN